MKRFVVLGILCILLVNGFAQEAAKQAPGIIAGNLLDSSNSKPITGATVILRSLKSAAPELNQLSDKQGIFSFKDLPYGYYQLAISFSGLQSVRIDSIHIREERYDFNLPDLYLLPVSAELERVVVYAEKPLIESKEGNITFNASESALAAGSNAGELLNNIPLVSKDPNGKILVRGKEPRILIDDKPVELNLQQLQDLLESMPGSSIEKIEVMTNPPPQFASEQGGVINITTRKGKKGMGGRISISAGTRGEGSINGNFNYRKNKFALTFNAGIGLNQFDGYGYSARVNRYNDSTNRLLTDNNFTNKNKRPNLRLNMDYEISKKQLLNLSTNLNQNDFDNSNHTTYTNYNRFDSIYKLSEREIRSQGLNQNANTNLTYTLKGKKAGESFRVILGGNLSLNDNDRRFYQQFFNPDHQPNGVDSTQNQATINRSNGFHTRLSYDIPLSKKTSISTGAAFNRSNSHIIVDAHYMKKPEGYFARLDLLSNDFRFHQNVINSRVSVKHLLGENFSVTAGMAAEHTGIWFELLKENRELDNQYWSYLPFGTINRNWKDKLSLTASYRRTIRRPGINELNPTIDFSDPYNIRFGNYRLKPSLAHNFDLVIGRTKPKYFLNLGMGYNLVQDIFSTVRTLLPDGKTEITWENISDRKEYEISTWNGYTISKQTRINLSASYVYNVYSAFDRDVKKFRNGGSFTSTLNGNYSIRDIWNYSGNFTVNRFANPQGSVNWSLGMNVGIQKKWLEKKLITTINIIDPFRNQQTQTYTYGKNFELSAFNSTETRNYRLTVAYQFSRK